MKNEFRPIQTSQMSSKDKLKNMLWHIVYVLLFRFSFSRFSIFRKWRVFLLRLFGAEIDWSVSVHPSAKIDFPWNLKMGKLSSLGEYSWTYALAPICIGETSCIGKDVYLLTGSHDINSQNFNLIRKPISIGNGVWVATGSYILPGVRLADMTVVAASAVVGKSTECNDVVGGNPAKFIKKREITR